ncbi:MAG TPA: hypothetical protein VFR21_15235 [Bradyrhizobium sp.]|nr:hypothetical protein [Bradyrhizobium sp.]
MIADQMDGPSFPAHVLAGAIRDSDAMKRRYERGASHEAMMLARLRACGARICHIGKGASAPYDLSLLRRPATNCLLA